MEYEIPDFLLAAPEIVLLTMVCVILIVDLFLSDAHRVWTYALSQLSLVGTAVLVFVMGGEDVAYTFNGMLVDDPMRKCSQSRLLTVAVMLAYRVPTLPRAKCIAASSSCFAVATLGMMVMISANHFLVLYLGLELLSLSLYAMVALPRDSGNSTEAAMKYFVLGALASGMLLYGMSMIYGATGSLEVTEVAQRIFDGDVIPTILIFGLVFVGCRHGLSWVPCLPMWVPDVYHGAPETAVTLLIEPRPSWRRSPSSCACWSRRWACSNCSSNGNRCW